MRKHAMNNEEQLENIEISIEQAKKAIDMMESLLKLTKNKDFKKVINEGYFEKEASRLVLLKADPSMQSPEDQRLLDNSIIAIGFLRQYFSAVIQMGRMAERSIANDEVTREELLGETL